MKGFLSQYEVTVKGITECTVNVAAGSDKEARCIVEDIVLRDESQNAHIVNMDPGLLDAQFIFN